MKSLVHFIAFSLLAPACAGAQEISLFNGRDLAGWSGLSEYWSVEGGAITGRVTNGNKSKGNTFLVWQGEVTDFELAFHFKLTAENPEGMANSGLQFRAQMGNPARFGLKGYQVELDSGSLRPRNWNTLGNVSGVVTNDPPGELLGTIGKKSQAPGMVLASLGTEQKVPDSYRPGDWNECRVIADGNRILTFINGLPATEVIDTRRSYTRGLLGFQLHNPLEPKTIQFKDIKLRHLKPGSAPSVPAITMPAPTPALSALSTIKTDANQPRIEVIKDQGPNATEWALTPLDEAIPADIRQNLTFLREDLLDEGANAAKSKPEAYKLASDYCDKLLAALSQREIARVQAGYQAAQADANKATSTQALDARRNYQMSWPQFSREESQRAALRESETNKADVKKQRLKVEWATRAEQMRLILDNTYRQLREAMR
ncbi:MAG: family 16 glycoside hydrolase [Prosthecobacter sp.]